MRNIKQMHSSNFDTTFIRFHTAILKHLWLPVSLTILLLLFPVVSASAVTIDYSRPFPALERLAHYNIIRLTDDTINQYTLDSAEIVIPKNRTVLFNSPCTVEVVPRCCVDSILILVRHSEDSVDTIFKNSTPPFRAVWNFATLPEQDQIHLQIGYVLYHCTGKVIISSPTPHHWTIDRSVKKRLPKYKASKIRSPDTVIVDGQLDEWKSARFDSFGHSATFASRWSRDHLYFAVDIRSKAICPDEFVELHLDPLFTKTSFSDECHRNIRFAPPGICTVIIPHDNKPASSMTADSIAALLTEDMVWRFLTDSSGYTIEISIPHYALSTLAFPRLRTGFDISLCKKTDGIYVCETWADCTTFNRYNPSEWGILDLHQSMIILKIALFLGISLFVFMFVYLLFKRFSPRSRKAHRSAEDEALLDNQFLQIEKSLEPIISDQKLTLSSFAEKCGMESKVLSGIITDRFSGGFDSFLLYHRLTNVKKLLKEHEMPIEEIAPASGFHSLEALTIAFVNHFKRSPEEYRTMTREIKLDETIDNDEYLSSAHSHLDSGRHHGSQR